ncbi:MAG TPA: ATP-grasp domain-containing protein [Gemmatimonadales bacterium]|nr:ATP-grasp domain-containing protein [Gemmatimonadales bacterium]
MTRTGLKIAILYDTWEDDGEEPTAVAEEATARGTRKRKASRRARRPKLDREEIFDALTKLGHEPSYLVLDGHDPSLLAVARTGADLIFNLTESYAGDDTKDMNLAAYLELLDKPYTGADPHALYLAQDKSLAKKVFHFHKIRTPFFAVSYKGRLDHAHDIEFPLIVKPLSEDGSIGIDATSVVESVKELMEKIHYIHDEFDSPALIEEYIEGREIYAAILGEAKPEALPLVELDLSRLPEGTPRIAGTDVKWEKDSEGFRKTRSRVVKDLDEKTVEKIQEKAVAAYQALKLRDYGRVDMRLTAKGEIYVLEANPNPWLSSGAEFAMAARESGRTYTDLMRDIVDLAMARYV